MEGKYQAYSEYTEVDDDCWIDRIPSHWSLKRISYIALLKSGDSIVSEKIEAEGDYPVYGGNGHRGYSKDYNHDGSYILIGRQGALCGNVNYGFGKFWASEHAVVVYPSVDVDLKWFGETLRAMNLNQYNISAAQPGLAISNLTCLKTPFPEVIEQQKITNFLDHETAKIDTLIEKQQQLIKLLKEKRQAVISHAVTKGLNPDVPMRDSGVEWLGEVPEHWGVGNLMYVLSAIGDVDHYMPESVDQGIPYVMTGDLKELTSNISFDSCKQVSQNDYFKLSKKIKSSKGDVIMARYATIGTASYIDVDTNFLVSYSCVTIKPDLAKVIGLYLFYYFKSDAFIQGIQNQVNTNTQGNVGVNDLKKVKVAIPPLTEQHKLIDSIQSTIAELDKISARSVTAIKLMQERRIALISAAVTGKIDVRNWQAPISESSNKEATA